jgi:hypothetical protein
VKQNDKEMLTTEQKEALHKILSEKYTTDFFNSELSERVFDYISDEDLQYEYQLYEEAYQELCMGGAIEYDILGEAWDEHRKLFPDMIFEEFDEIMTPIFNKNCTWKDTFVFRENKYVES